MCFDPVSAAMFLVSAGSSVAKFAGEKQVADGQTAAYDQNYQNSLAAARDSQQQLTLRQMQEQEATAQKDHKMVVDQAKAEAAASVSAAGANVSGLSVDNLIGDVRRQTTQNRTNNQRNWEMTAQQLQTEKDATNTTAQSRINSMQPGTDPSPLGLVIDIAGAGVKSFAG